ncbi:MAG: response regulator, partial [Lachnospiraceae bacterium]|nr:response regulator [Lachnospiraceae bacterium]
MNEMILRESGEQEVIEYAENIRTAGSTLLGLVNDILDFSKIEAGKMEIIPVDYDLSAIINNLVNMIQARMEKTGLQLKLHFVEKTPRRLNGDEVRIRQVITNLLTNAIKYTKKGEVVLSVQLLEAGNPAKIKVSVRDTGVGIREEDQQVLFSAFRRVDEKKNRNIEGTGLGLAICVYILELMNSVLKLKSEYGKGSDFSFILEQDVVDETPVGRLSIAEEETGRKVEITRENFTAPDARILVVDDVELNLTVFMQLLKNSGIVIDTANTGAQSLDMIRSTEYDIVFMDYLMPEMDGIETLKKGIAEGVIDTGKLPVIALTANAISGAKEMFISEGFVDYLTKPIEIKQLLDMLAKYLPEEKVIHK